MPNTTSPPIGRPSRLWVLACVYRMLAVHIAFSLFLNFQIVGSLACQPCPASPIISVYARSLPCDQQNPQQLQHEVSPHSNGNRIEANSTTVERKKAPGMDGWTAMTEDTTTLFAKAKSSARVLNKQLRIKSDLSVSALQEQPFSSSFATMISNAHIQRELVVIEEFVGNNGLRVSLVRTKWRTYCVTTSPHDGKQIGISCPARIR